MKNTDNSIYQLNLDHSQSTDKCQEILEKIAAEKNITVEIKQIDFRNRITLEFKNNADYTRLMDELDRTSINMQNERDAKALELRLDQAERYGADVDHLRSSPSKKDEQTEEFDHTKASPEQLALLIRHGYEIPNQEKPTQGGGTPLLIDYELT